MEGGQRRMLGVREAARYCGVSHNTFEAYVKVSPIRIGKRKLWDRQALDRWLDGQGGRTNHAPSLSERAGLWGKSA